MEFPWTERPENQLSEWLPTCSDWVVYNGSNNRSSENSTTNDDYRQQTPATAAKTTRTITTVIIIKPSKYRSSSSFLSFLLPLLLHLFFNNISSFLHFYQIKHCSVIPLPLLPDIVPLSKKNKKNESTSAFWYFKKQNTLAVISF